MEVTRDDLDWAVAQGLLSEEQSGKLEQAWEERHAAKPKFDFAHLAYYFGAFIIIAAMGWLMNDTWEKFGGWGIFGVAAGYAAVFAILGWYLYFKKNIRIPGGLLFTLAVWMTPLMVYGLERATGFWPADDPGVYSGYYDWVKGGWFFMELATVVVGLAVLRFVRFPFLTFPIAFALWFMSMDLVPLLFGKPYDSEGGYYYSYRLYWTLRCYVSAAVGLSMIVIAFWIDRRTKDDYAFWLYLFGLMAFWGGLSLLESQSQWRKFFYCMINVGLVWLSVVLRRKVFLVFGSLGVFGYLSYLAHDVFRNSMIFPFVLSIIGLAILFLGLLYMRFRKPIEKAFLELLPPVLIKSLPQYRNSPRP